MSQLEDRIRASRERDKRRRDAYETLRGALHTYPTCGMFEGDACPCGDTFIVSDAIVTTFNTLAGERRDSAKHEARAAQDADYQAREAEQIRQSTERVKAREAARRN